MDSTSSDNYSEWDNLSTISTFDTGEKECSSTQLVGGEQLTQLGSPQVTTPISLLVQSLIQQLCTVLESDRDKATRLYHSICEKLHEVKLLDETYAMGEFETMRLQYQRALRQLVSVAGGEKLPASYQSGWPLPADSGLEWSRYFREFEEMFYIAGGGFGSVYKARHRLDGVEYAIKKICIRSSDVSSVLTHLAEVKTFAGLSHPNVVTYKAAWLEPLIQRKTNFPDSSARDSNSQSGTTSSDRVVDDDESEDYLSKSDSDFNVQFKNSRSDTSSSKSEFINLSLKEAEDCQALCKLENNQIVYKYNIKASHVNLEWATLFIQMSLCQRTLKQWLEHRNSMTILNQDTPSPVLNCVTDPLDMFPRTNLILEERNILNNGDIMNILEMPRTKVIIDILSQMASGVDYIHRRDIIHHDIKPSNIFICLENNTINVQIGDFGLACPQQKSHGGAALGTPLYAAPEQLEGLCNKKSDLYSIGIILLEMIESFDTEMEKSKVLGQLREGNMPSRVTVNYPQLAHILSKLVEKKLKKRIDTTQLLQMIHELKEDKDEIIRALREETRLLREVGAAKDDEIARLKLMLSKK